jgi:SEC-C motif
VIPEVLWHERSPERWQAEQEIARKLLGNFHTGISVGGVAFVQGDFVVRSRHGHVYESVAIRVEYPPSFPDRGQIPTVVLMSHRDRWHNRGNSHIIADWSLCLFVPGDSGIDFRQAGSLGALFAVLHTFLFKEHVYQQALTREALTGERAIWPGEARSHGVAGVLEAVRERGRLRRNEPCPCGSGKKFKVCCMQRIRR